MLSWPVPDGRKIYILTRGELSKLPADAIVVRAIKGDDITAEEARREWEDTLAPFLGLDSGLVPYGVYYPILDYGPYRSWTD